MAKYLRYESGESYRYGRLDGTTITPLDGIFPNFTPSKDPTVELGSVKLLAPTVPTRIVSAGPGFKNGGDPAMAPTIPTFWHKPLAAQNDPEGIIEIPDDDWPGIVHECEFAIVIGKKAKRISVEEAKDHIFGYMIYNDITRGDFNPGGKGFANTCYYAYGKTYDGFAPMGPYVVTDIDPTNLRMICRVNGEVRQDHNTSDRLFTNEQIVSWLSHMGTLNPGDVISTGSPPGMTWLKDGDVVECEIEELGILRNYVRKNPVPPPPEMVGRRDLYWPHKPVGSD